MPQYVQHMINYASGGKESFQGKKVALSGSGNVAQYAALKAIELGATIVSLSDSKGSLIATEGKGITPELVSIIADLKVKRKALSELANASEYKDQFKYIENDRPWKHVGSVDVALPSATQNEVSGDEAEALVSAGCKFIAEGSNMGCTQEAIDVFEKTRKEKKNGAMWYAPGKPPPVPQPQLSDRSTNFVPQAKPPTPAVSLSPVSRWLRTRHVWSGPPRKSTPSSRASWRTASPIVSRPPRSTSLPPRASSPAWSLVETLLGSRRSRRLCMTRVIGGERCTQVEL